MATVINFSIGVGVFIALQHQSRSKICTKGLYYHFFSQKKSLFFRQEFEENNIYESGIYKHITLN